MRTTLSHGRTPIILTAALSIAGLLAAIGFQLGGAREPGSATGTQPEHPLPIPVTHLSGERDWKDELIRLGIIASSTAQTAADTTTGTSTDPLTRINEVIAEETLQSYLSLKENDAFSKERANELGAYIGTNIVPAPTNTPHTKLELKRTPDTSTARTLSYRADMRTALAVLITDMPPEIETFAYYIETKNPSRLRELEAAAARYQEAEENMLGVTVPDDAADLHLRALNSLGAYGNTLERLVLFADQPLASLALLRTYNETEREMLYAFDALAEYYVQKGTQ